MTDRLVRARQSRNADNEERCYERTAGICEAKGRLGSADSAYHALNAPVATTASGLRRHRV